MTTGPELRYAVAACQTDFPCPADRSEITSRVDRMLSMVEGAVHGYRPMFPVRLVVFPEFAHTAPVYPSARALRDRLAVPVPNEHTERYAAKARELGIYIQTGTFIEVDPKYPEAIFNTTCLIGSEGVLSKYRKVNTWIPWEIHSSPHDVPGYEEELFPVTTTPIGAIGCAICYDWLFPEAIRQLAFKGAEIMIRVSAYMDPWGATPPMDWWTVVNRCRALENLAYVVAANQGASLKNYAPFSWPGGSMIVDFDGRILSQADAGPGEKIVVAEVDLGALRHARKTRLGHNPLPHLRREAYRASPAGYPQNTLQAPGDSTAGRNEERIRAGIQKTFPD